MAVGIQTGHEAEDVMEKEITGGDPSEDLGGTFRANRVKIAFPKKRIAE